MTKRAAKASGARWMLGLRIAVVAAALVALVVLGRAGGAYVPTFAHWVDSLGAWGPVAFIAGYVVAVVVLIPGSIFTLAAGAIFGLARGTAYAFVAATLGASASFLVSRTIARRFVERRLRRSKRFQAIDRAVESQGRKIVFLLRLSPVFPFSLLNYGLGLTRIRFADYALASIGMLPGTLLYVYYGKLAGDVAALAGGTGVRRGTGYYAILAVGLAATVVATALVTRVARKALREAAGDLEAEGPSRAVGKATGE